MPKIQTKTMKLDSPQTIQIDLNNDLELQIKNLERLQSYFNDCLLKHYQCLNKVSQKIHAKDKDIQTDLLGFQAMFIDDQKGLEMIEFSPTSFLLRLEGKCKKYFDAHRFLEKKRAIKRNWINLFDLPKGVNSGEIGGYVDRMKKNLEENHKNIAQSISQTMVLLMKRN